MVYFRLCATLVLLGATALTKQTRFEIGDDHHLPTLLVFDFGGARCYCHWRELSLTMMIPHQEKSYAAVVRVYQEVRRY